MFRLRIGIDIDNTILDFGEAIRRASLEILGINLEQHATKSSSALRIRELAGNDVWTDLQGYVYAEYSQYASTFQGALATISRLRARGEEIKLISHKTRRPASGREVDLHHWTHSTLERTGVLEAVLSDFTAQGRSITLCESLEEKIGEISSQDCVVFIDDLVKVLEPLPSDIRKIHIFCDGQHSKNVAVECHTDWEEVAASLG